MKLCSLVLKLTFCFFCGQRSNFLNCNIISKIWIVNCYSSFMNRIDIAPYPQEHQFFCYYRSSTSLQITIFIHCFIDLLFFVGNCPDGNSFILPTLLCCGVLYSFLLLYFVFAFLDLDSSNTDCKLSNINLKRDYMCRMQRFYFERNEIIIIMSYLYTPLELPTEIVSISDHRVASLNKVVNQTTAINMKWLFITL